MSAKEVIRENDDIIKGTICAAGYGGSGAA